MKLNLLLERSGLSVITLGIIATMFSLVIGIFFSKKEFYIPPDLTNSVVQALLISLTAGIGYLFAMKIGKEKKELREALRDYEKRVDDYRLKISKERKIEEKLKEDLKNTREQLNKVLKDSEIKGKKLEELRLALNSYESKIESIEETKNLYESYVTWSKELKSLFELFLLNPQVYVEEAENAISLRTDKERDMNKVKPPYIHTTSYKKNEVKDQFLFLVKSGIINFEVAQKEDACDYILSLTEKGKKLRNSLLQNPPSED